MSDDSPGSTPLSTLARLRRALQLGWKRRSDLLRATILLPRASWTLRRHGYRAALGWSISPLAARPPVGGPTFADQTITDAQEIGFAVRLVARLMPDASCLRRTLAQRRLLAHRGVQSTVCLGARPGDAAPSFHAWLEIDGAVVSENPSGVADFVRLDVRPD